MSDIDTDALAQACRATFQEHDGLLLRDGAWTPETLSAWKAQMKGEAAALESVVNHMHLRQVFFDADEYLVDEIVSAAHQIRASWLQTLGSMFPDQSFDVQFIRPTGADADIGEYQLTVWRKRGAA